MLKLIIGVDELHSISGKKIEQALRDVLYLDEFDVVPYRENWEYDTDLFKLYNRAVYIAEQMRKHGDSLFYLGVTSGICEFKFTGEQIRGRGWLDVFAMFNSKGKQVTTHCLNPVDAKRQIKLKRCADWVPPESVSRFSINVSKFLQSTKAS